MEKLRVVGARTHNLHNLSVEIPKNKITVITGLSGSGKSSLAFDTIFAEGQRRYIESLSSFVRQFLSNIERPDFDYIEGLAPAIAIDQKTAGRNPRSTVATTTEIYDFLRVLFARIGRPYCPSCKILVDSQTPEAISAKILELFTQDERLYVKIFACVVTNKRGEHKFQLKAAKKLDIIKVRFDGVEMDIDEAIALEVDKNKKHSLELLVATIDFPISNDQSRELTRIEILKNVEKALKYGNGTLIALGRAIEQEKPKLVYYSQRHACSQCGWQFPLINSQLFSFNNPEGACVGCRGLGVRQVAEPELVLPNPRLSIAEGAIRPWSRTTSQTSWYQKVLKGLAERRNFSLDTPIGNLTDEQRLYLLFGEPEETPDRFEGIIFNLEKRHRETDSDYLRQEIEKYMVEKRCDLCNGQRLRQEALSILIGEKNIIDVTEMTIQKAADFFDTVEKSIKDREQPIAQPIIKEISSRLNYLKEVGLAYLNLNRVTATLAGGEAQRIRLANQLGSGLTGVIYILDEPSIGLHPQDHQKLLSTIERLKKHGNTVIIVEHDRETMLSADYIIDMGPGAGERGGEIVSQGKPQEIIADPRSLTGRYLSNEKKITMPRPLFGGNDESLVIRGATGNNLKNIEVSIPLNRFVCVTGVSGSGKSTLISDTLAAVLENHFKKSSRATLPYQQVIGLDKIDSVINIDQTPIGRTPRSNPATYTGVLGPIRELLAATEEAASRGFDPARFSFNLRGGRCENCRGDGQIKIEMNFLPDVYVVCSVCRGKRFNNETLEIRYKEKNISEILQMTVDEALDFFEHDIEIKEKLAVLESVGLGYIRLGQSATTLSGGEAQRIKLATELMRRDTGKTLYILDEPTTGLHFEDIQRLLRVLATLIDRGNSVVVIEHNLDVIACADWIIDLGPGGGDEGGHLVVAGTPETVAANNRSATGRCLADAKLVG